MSNVQAGATDSKRGRMLLSGLTRACVYCTCHPFVAGFFSPDKSAPMDAFHGIEQLTSNDD